MTISRQTVETLGLTRTSVVTLLQRTLWPDETFNHHTKEKSTIPPDLFVVTAVLVSRKLTKARFS